MDTLYMRQLRELIRGANRELDRAQVMEEPPASSFVDLLSDTETAWVDAARRFSAREQNQ